MSTSFGPQTKRKSMENVVYLEEATKALGAAAYGPDDTSKKQVEAWLSKIKSGQKNATDSKVSFRTPSRATFEVRKLLTEVRTSTTMKCTATNEVGLTIARIPFSFAHSCADSFERSSKWQARLGHGLPRRCPGFMSCLPSALLLTSILTPSLFLPFSRRRLSSVCQMMGPIRISRCKNQAIDSQLASLTYLVANTLTLADLALFSTQYHVVSSMTAASQHTVPSLVRFISHLSHVATNDARTSQATLAAGYNAFDPTFEGQPQVKRKDPVAEKQQEKQKQAALAAAAAGAGDKTAKKSASEEAAASSSSSGAGATAEGCEKQGKKKEKKAKEGVKSGGGNSGGGEAKKGKNEPAAPTVPLPSMVDLRVGKILDIKKHPDADSLYLETVDFGEAEGPRTVLSGLVNYVSMDKMQDRLVVGICNLKPQAMRGIKSHAMLLCATHKDGKEHGVEPIAPPEASVPGERIYIEGYEGIEPEPVLNPKKKVCKNDLCNLIPL